MVCIEMLCVKVIFRLLCVEVSCFKVLCIATLYGKVLCVQILRCGLQVDPTVMC